MGHLHELAAPITSCGLATPQRSLRSTVNTAARKCAAQAKPAGPRRRGRTVTQSMSPVIVAGVGPAVASSAVITRSRDAALQVARRSGSIADSICQSRRSASQLAAVVVFQTLNLYTIAAFRAQGQQLARIATAWTAIFLIGFAIAFFAKFETAYSRVWAVSLYVVGSGRSLYWPRDPDGAGAALGARRPPCPPGRYRRRRPRRRRR